jgi:hypothetical protein
MMRPRPAAAARPPAPKRVPWTWLERFLVAQALIPALLFVPGISSGRVVIRMASFFLALAVWFIALQSGRAGSSTFSPTFWLKLVTGWLLLMIFHWGTTSIIAALAQVTLYIAVLSPAFWAPGLLSSSRQLRRLMTILLICNGISALVGLGQVFRPQTFNPPVIPGITGTEESLTALALTYVDQYGQKIIRPCGLSDTPGAAAAAGGAATLAGLALALRPIGLLKRLICAATAFCGMAVIYYSQVRMVFMMEIICLAVLTGIFVLQKNYGYAAMLSGLGAVIVAGAFAWVMARSGLVVVERFLGLAKTSLSESYQNSGRAAFVNHTLGRMMWQDPLGQGIGRWGTIGGTFGNPNDRGVFVEIMIQAWVVDGGIPLLLSYGIAIALAMTRTFQIALRSRDREIRFWAAVVFASNLSVIATCFSYVAFIGVMGTQFWFLSAVVHAADCRVRQDAAAQARRSLARPTPAPPRPPGPPPRPYPA